MGGSLDNLVDDLRDAAVALVNAAGAARLQPRVTSTVRTHSEQRRLYNRYLAGAAGFPVAPPGYSAHEYGEAFDMVVSPMSAIADVGYTWQQWGGGWNPADAVHFELPGASERAKRRGEEAGFDPLLTVAQFNATLPWYVQLLTPWQLTIYNDYPWVRAAMRTAAFGGTDMLKATIRSIFG
jgi:hypothetical protein